MKPSLIQIALATLAAAAFAAGLVVFRVTNEQIQVQTQDSLRALAGLYASVAMTSTNGAQSEQAIHQAVHSLAQHREVTEIVVFGREPLRALGASRNHDVGRAVNDFPHLVAKGLRLDEDLDVQYQLDVEHHEFTCVVPFSITNLNDPSLQSRPEHRVPGLVYVRLDAADILRRADVHRRDLLLAVLGTIASVLVIGLGMLYQHGLSPLRRLGQAMKDRARSAEASSPPPMPNHDMRQLAGEIWSTFSALEHSNAHMRAIVGSATDAILTIDRRGSIVQFNPGAERMLGIRAEAALGRNVQFIVPIELRRAHAESMQAVADGRKPEIFGFSRELDALRADGTRFPCSLAVNATRLNGESYYVGIIRDRTNEIEAARALERAQEEAQEGQRTKASFLANVSHEIRTPLTAILGYAEELEHFDLSKEEREAALRVIQRNGQHLTRIVDDILDLSKIDQGNLQVQCRRCSPDELLDDVQSVAVPRARQKGIAFEIRRTGPVPVSIETDPVRLRQILLNLVGNAVKFTESGSVAVEVASDPAKETISFSVVDTGIGIPPERQHLLFQSFSQTDSSISRRHGGTGLGLYISRRLAQLLGGDITVDSAAGRGSRFTVTVATGPVTASAPASERETPSRSRTSQTSIPRLEGRVLVADDGPDNRRLIEKILRATGLEVEVVENGALAVDAVLHAGANREFDLVFMDMQMPVMDGLAATRALRESGYSGPIVALTANVLPEDRQRCEAAGCSHFAGKPIDRKAIYEMLSETLAASGR